MRRAEGLYPENAMRERKREMAEVVRKPGDSNRITREYLDSLLIETRYIGSTEASTKFRLFGETFSTPVMTAALSHLDTFARPGGMREMAEGAKLADAVMWMGMAETEEVEKCAQTGARIVEVIKPYADREEIYKRIEQAQKLKLLAVGVDVDFVYDADGEPKNFHGWPLKEFTEAELKEIADYAKASGLPFIVKGVLSTRDAYSAVQAGADGLVVSHHGNSVEFAVPPLYMLPMLVCEEPLKKAKYFVDCEIQTGMDAYKALALGASGVSVGRPLMAAIRENGAQGAAELLQKMTKQLKKAMLATGCRTLDDISDRVLYQL